MINKKFKWYMYLLIPLFAICCIAAMPIIFAAVILWIPFSLFTNIFCTMFNIEIPWWAIDNGGGYY